MIRLRERDEAGVTKEWEISYEEFERLLDTGEPDPELQVSSEHLTQGQWKRLGDLTIYKRAVAAREGGGSLGLRDIVERTHGMVEHVPPGSVPPRYAALRTVAGAFKVLAWLAAIVCVIAAIVSVTAGRRMGSSGAGLLAGLAYVVVAAIGFVGFYATAESILVLIDIEENTRATGVLTQNLAEAIARLGAGPAERK